MIKRKCVLALLVIVIALSGTIQVTAWKASEFRLVAGDIVVGRDIILQRPSQTVFHDQSLAASDTEALAISLPAKADADHIASLSTGPAIAQTSDATVTATDTGFYKANWCYMYFMNSGGWPLSGMTGMHPIRSSSVMGSGLIWPYMTPAPASAQGVSAMKFKPYIDSSNGGGNVTMALGSGIANNTSATKPHASNGGFNRSYATLKNATKEQVANASTFDRVYRNANLVNTIPLTHEGSVERPTWIDRKPDQVLRQVDMTKVIDNSLNMTKPGAQLHTVFWDL